MSVADEINQIRELLRMLYSLSDSSADSDLAAAETELEALELAAEEVEALTDRVTEHLSKNTLDGIEAAQAEFDAVLDLVNRR